MRRRKDLPQRSNSHVRRLRPEVIITFFLILSTLTVYWQIRNHDFLTFDDDDYVTENDRVKAGWTSQGLRWAFTTRYHKHWHPLTWLSHMTDCQLFGLNSGWHHLSSLLFHIVSALLLFFAFIHMTDKLFQSFFIAALFALHPLHVESVAWVADRKDVLSGFFWMMTIYTYVHYSKSPGPFKYLLVILLYLMALLAKPMAITLPVVLVLLDYWPLRRFQTLRSREEQRPKKGRALNAVQKDGLSSRLIWEKAGLFFLVGAGSLVFLAARKGRSVDFSTILSTKAQIANSLYYYVSYIGKMLWPFNLAVPYPKPDMLPIWQIVGAGLLLLAITFLVFWKGRRYSYLPVGWLWYLITLLPVIGIVRVGPHAMADRYTYLPITGLFIMIAWGIPDILSHWRRRRIVLGLSAGGVLSTLMILTWFQVGYWKNTITVFTHSVNVTANNFVAHNNLGTALKRQGDVEEAIRHYSKAIEIKPHSAIGYYNLGAAWKAVGDLEAAIRHYSEAVRINPDFADGHNKLGLALMHEGDLEAAIGHFSKALKIKSKFADAHNNLGTALFRQGDLKGAIRHFSEAVLMEPGNAEWQNNLGMAFLDLGDLNKAMAHLSEAVKIEPSHLDAQNNLGLAFMRKGDLEAAIQHFSTAVRIQPDHADSHVNLGGALVGLGKLEEAMQHFSEALRIKPDHAEAHMNMGTALASQGKLNEAIAHLSETVQINPEHARAHNNLGIALASIGKLEEAIRYFSEAVRIDPEDAEAQNNLGTALASIGKLEEAIPHFSEAVRINPNHENARNNLELALKMAGKSEESLETIQKP